MYERRKHLRLVRRRHLTASMRVQVELGFRVSEPMARSIKGAGGGVLCHYSLLVDPIDVPDNGKTGLVITGHTDLEIPVINRTYVAYPNVEVVD